MANAPDIAVTGVTGHIGGRVARRLAERGVSQRIVVRDLSSAPDIAGALAVQAPSYGDAPAMRAALEGTRTLFLVSARETQDRLQQHLTAVNAARAAGVERIVYLSFVGAAPEATFTLARQHYETEEAIRAAIPHWTFLRSSLYADFVPYIAGEDGVIRGPAGDGRVAWTPRDDVADVAAAVVLAGDEHDCKTYNTTGARTLSCAETAEILGAVTGRPIRYHAETIEEAWGSRRHFGAPDWEVDGWITSYAAVANGEMDIVSDTVARVTGRPAAELEPFLRANPDLWRHLS
jgi:NAD(P)H dehydrogenase (quinone)